MPEVNVNEATHEKMAARTARLATYPGLPAVEEIVRAAGEVQRHGIVQANREAADLIRTTVDLVAEQTVHDIETMTELLQARHWGEVAQIQNRFLQASLARKLYLAHRCWQTSQGVMLATALAAQEQVERQAYAFSL